MSEPSGALVHIAGPVVTIGPRVRQRCMWCGAGLIDYDLERIQVEVPADGSEPLPPATWEVGSLVAVDGENPKVTSALASAAETWGCPEPEVGEDCARSHGELAELPAASCTRLDPAATS